MSHLLITLTLMYKQISDTTTEQPMRFDVADPILVAEQDLMETERLVNRLRGCQLALLKSIMRRWGTGRDGYRSPVDWTAWLLDIPRSTAADLVHLAHSLDDDAIRRIRQESLRFDQLIAETRCRQASAGGPEDDEGGIIELLERDVERLPPTFSNPSEKGPQEML